VLAGARHHDRDPSFPGFCRNTPLSPAFLPHPTRVRRQYTDQTFID
jgi:hypothetical protein